MYVSKGLDMLCLCMLRCVHKEFDLDSSRVESEKSGLQAKAYRSQPMGCRRMAVRKNGSGKPEALLLTVMEAARLLRVSRNLAYELVAQGRLPHIRLGRRVLVPRHGLEQWIAREAGLPWTPLAAVTSTIQH